METQAMNTISSDIEGAAASLGALAGTVSPEVWEYLRLLRRNLLASAEQVASLESRAVQESDADLYHYVPREEGSHA